MKILGRSEIAAIEADRQRLAELNSELATLSSDMARLRVASSPQVIARQLAEFDPRLLQLMIDRGTSEVLIGQNSLIAGSRRRAVETMRIAASRRPGGDVQIANATDTWTDWGFGRKLEISAVDPQADVVWAECWGAPRNRGLFGQSVIHELSHDVLTDGEAFFVAYASRQDGEVTWRTFDSLAVLDILHPKNDKSINVWYIVQLEEKQVAIPDAFTYFALRDRLEGVKLPEGVEDINATADALESGGTFAAIVPAMRNRDSEGRGWPEFTLALPWSDVYAQMLREYSAVFSAVAMFVDKLKVEGGSRTLNDVIAQFQSSLATTAGGYYDTNPRAAAGSTALENEAAERTRLPLGSAAGDAQTGTGILALQLATGLHVKASDVGRVDMFQNKATADIAAESPQQAWQRYQLSWASVWSDIVETTLRLYEEFNKGAKFASYESEISTSLPANIETTDIAMAMKANSDAATAMTLDYGIAARANAILAGMLLLDLGVDDVDAILEPPETAESDAATVAHLGESHKPITVAYRCPLCGFNEAYSYEGHGPLLVCAGCGGTYDTEVE